MYNKFILDFNQNLTNIFLLQPEITFPILCLFPLVVLKLKLRICTRSRCNMAWTAVTGHCNWFPWSTDWPSVKLSLSKSTSCKKDFSTSLQCTETYLWDLVCVWSQRTQRSSPYPHEECRTDAPGEQPLRNLWQREKTFFISFWRGGCCITKTHASQQHKEIHKHKTQREDTWTAISFELLQFLFSRENSSSCSSHPALKGIDILWELIPPRRNMMQPWVRKELRYDFSFCSLARPSWLITRVCKIGGVGGHVIAPI